MRLNTDWIFQEPIDLEHKQYVLLDYINKVNKDFEDFKIYPSFQELAIHLANIGAIREQGKFVRLRREPEDIDDEILINDLKYIQLGYKKDELEEIKKIIKYSQDKLTDLFLVGKSMWSLVYDNVLIKNVYNNIKEIETKPGVGFFYIIYDELLYVYQYKIGTLTSKTNENKCWVELIYKGDVVDVTQKEELTNIIKSNFKQVGSTKKEKFIENIDTSFPIFRVKYEEKFPLEGSILSISKRKIMNYIFQTIKIQELKG
jgi:hypothetical protein|tara:strand:+ start:586 stop:1362 length:777 start_codon:yes stop_codon:yes gene_type:complete